MNRRRLATFLFATAALLTVAAFVLAPERLGTLVSDLRRGPLG